MTKIATTKKFQQNHPGLAARLAGVVGSLEVTREVIICDASEHDTHRAGFVPVRHEPEAPTIMAGNPLRELVYDGGHPEMALAALIARIGAEGGEGPIGADPESLTVYALAGRLAATDVPVLITGPTGAGKEVLSRHIHRLSNRAKGPFVALNCAAIPEAMLEAMLFGHIKGAFTGATAASLGHFREADGGTLLLDEIAEMPLPLQAKLLRALQEGEVTPVGATRPIKVDVRILACANRHLPDEVAAGRFREDLFYRLNVFPIAMPPISQRPGDIAPLAASLLLKHTMTAGGPRWIEMAAFTALCRHRWPGNVRELENVIRRAVVLAGKGKTIGIDHIVFDQLSSVAQVDESKSSFDLPAEDDATDPLSSVVKRSEAKAIIETLRACGGRRVDAAKRLGISERTLRYRLASYRDAGVPLEAAL
ncbi:sigma-54 interaction domain-containing protein [Qipengyuania sp.]|uniref:sigma-54 interaction domain-containing protein n=1 Tax=Qipengyuania sp. TaxID=2004515 RepID=UPI0035C858C1